MDNRELDEYLLEILLALRGEVEAEEYPSNGICAYVSDAAEEDGLLSGYQIDHVLDEVLPELFMHWPGYSGDEAYPVPDPEGKHGKLFHRSSSTMKWSPQYEYGAKRRDLLDFCIILLEERTS